MTGQPDAACRQDGHVSAGDQLVDVSVRSPEVLPGRSRLSEQFDASATKLLDSRGQVTDREADDRPAIKVLPALVERAEDLNIPAIGEFEDPQARFGMHWSQSEHVLVEVRQLLIMFGAGTAPAQACDIHACQYRCQWPLTIAVLASKVSRRERGRMGMFPDSAACR